MELLLITKHKKVNQGFQLIHIQSNEAQRKKTLLHVLSAAY